MLDQIVHMTPTIDALHLCTQACAVLGRTVQPYLLPLLPNTPVSFRVGALVLLHICRREKSNSKEIRHSRTERLQPIFVIRTRISVDTHLDTQEQGTCNHGKTVHLQES